MFDEIRKLIKLQEIDSELDSLIEECSFIPAEIENKKNLISEMKNKLEEDRKKLKNFQVQHKELDLELISCEDAIKKHKTELNIVKTNEQYKALLAEIAKKETEKSGIEDKILQLMENIDSYSNMLKEKEKKLKEEEVKILEQIKSLEEKKKNLEEQIKTQENKRREFSNTIKLDILKKYEHIRESKEDGVAIAAIENNHCGCCRIKLPPQVINEVSKGNDLVLCDNCTRILYLSIIKDAGKSQGSVQINIGQESPNSH